MQTIIAVLESEFPLHNLALKNDKKYDKRLVHLMPDLRIGRWAIEL